MPLDFIGWERLPVSPAFSTANAQNKLTPSSLGHKRSAPRDIPLDPNRPPLGACNAADTLPRSEVATTLDSQHTQRHGCSTQLVSPGQRYLGANFLPQARASG